MAKGPITLELHRALRENFLALVLSRLRMLSVHASVPISAHYTHSCSQCSLFLFFLAPFLTAHHHMALKPPPMSHPAADPPHLFLPLLPCVHPVPTYTYFSIQYLNDLFRLLSPLAASTLAVTATQFSFIFPLYPQQTLPRSAINFS